MKTPIAQRAIHNSFFVFAMVGGIELPSLPRFKFEFVPWGSKQASCA